MRDTAIIYDQNCPACAAYTKAFVAFGFIAQDKRIAFRELNGQEYLNWIDFKRAGDEIPVIDQEHKRVIYGLDGLLFILGTKLAWIKPLVQVKPVYRLLKHVYRLISLNRRLIIPPVQQQTCSYTAEPSFNLKYRLLYLLLCWLCVAKVLGSYAGLLSDYVPVSSFLRELLICGGQLLFQTVFILSSGIPKRRLSDYLGNMMSVSMGGALLLLPAFVLHYAFPFSVSLPYLIWFMCVVVLMFFEHSRRVKLLGLPYWLSLSWLLYRLLLLPLLLL